MHQHFILFKPYGYLSQFVCEHQNKKLLGDLYQFPDGTMAIGRLDEDSEGLLLLTTDGQESENVRAKSVEKEYYVQLDGVITNEAIRLLESGVEIGFDGTKYQTRPSLVKRLDVVPDFPKRAKKIRDDRHGPTSWISIIIHEGKFRQVRKMTAAVGFPTLRLIRYRIADYTIEGFDAGEVRILDRIDVNA